MKNKAVIFGSIIVLLAGGDLPDDVAGEHYGARCRLTAGGLVAVSFPGDPDAGPGGAGCEARYLQTPPCRR